MVGPKDILEMLGEACQPFCCEVDGHKVKISKLDTAMMLRNDVGEMITNKLQLSPPLELYKC